MSINLQELEQIANNNINTLTKFTPFFLYSQPNISAKPREIVAIIDKECIIDRVDDYISKLKNGQGQRSHAIDLNPICTYQSNIDVDSLNGFVKAVYGDIPKPFCKVFVYETVNGKYREFSKLFENEIRNGTKQITLTEFDIPVKASEIELRSFGYNENAMMMEKDANSVERLPMAAEPIISTVATVNNATVTNNNNRINNNNSQTVCNVNNNFKVKRSSMGGIRKQHKTKIRKVSVVNNSNVQLRQQQLLQKSLQNNNTQNTTTLIKKNVKDMTSSELMQYIKEAKDNTVLRIDDEQFKVIYTFFIQEEIDGEVFLALKSNSMINSGGFSFGLAQKVKTFIKHLKRK
ncbi:hypothetical protein ABK040_016783 [Willaertia magna]